MPLCGFCQGLAFFATGHYPKYSELCPFQDAECAAEDERTATWNYLKSPAGRAETHHQALELVGLPCDRRCHPPARRTPSLGPSLIERVKAAYRIEDVADRLTSMKWRGNRGMGRCPFHQDKSPSFSVDIEKQLWHCFAACGAGDVIDLLRKADEQGVRVG